MNAGVSIVLIVGDTAEVEFSVVTQIHNGMIHRIGKI